MTTPRARLTEADIRRLVRGDSLEDRETAARNLCVAVERAAITEGERIAAQNILRIMADDAAERVRRALSVTLGASSLLPRDAALKLARDVDEIALPVIAASPAFTDEDLVEILQAGSAPRQVAVARRPRLSERVAGVIADVAVEAAVLAACANDNAAFSDAALGRALDRFGGSQEVADAVAWRAQVPAMIGERLVALVSEAARRHLVEAHALELDTAMALSTGARERVTVDLLEQADLSADLAGFVSHLNRGRRLTASLLLRALAGGQMGFFEQGVAELSGVAFSRTWLMIHDAGPLGLRAIYERAGLPSRLFPAFRAGVDAWRSLHGEGDLFDRERFRARMLERFLTQQPDVAREDLDYLLERLDRTYEDALPPVHANAA